MLWLHWRSFKEPIKKQMDSREVLISMHIENSKAKTIGNSEIDHYTDYDAKSNFNK